MTIHIFGIRHHGPRSAKSLVQALDSLMPDIILVEGPPDADALIPLFAHEDTEPPFAILLYVPESPRLSAYYPFAEFSPEYQAIRWGLSQQIAVRFMDLPLKYIMRERKDAQDAALAQQTGDDRDSADDDFDQMADDTATQPEQVMRSDPLGELAKAAGYTDGERWWEQMVESREGDQDIFQAVLEAMTALRQEGILSHMPLEEQREAYMRRIIHQARREGYERIAVVCGAWHAPALAHMPTQKHDQQILKGMKQTKLEMTITPWTHRRLSKWSGYGAGIWSPGWYQHLWQSDNEHHVISWMSKVSGLLRAEGLDASPAQVIDAVRLAETLATMRQRHIPSLEELNEVAISVFCFGNDAPLRLIHDKLIVGEVMGAVPDSVPMMPLQRDLRRQQKHLRLKQSPQPSQLKLDLRKEQGLARSHLLHRLNILGINWAKKVDSTRGRGTFNEIWELMWQPEQTIRIIECSLWGNTVLDATSAYAKHLAKEADDLQTLTALINEILFADVPDAINYVIRRLQVEAAATGDIIQLMRATPALADVLNYSNVRQTDAAMVREVVEGMITRVCIGLPAECTALDDKAAETVYQAILQFNTAIYLVNKASYSTAWHQVLTALMSENATHGLIKGRACRILFDESQIDQAEARRQMQLAIALVGDIHHVAAWLEGFLRDSGLILVHDEFLLSIIDDWLVALRNENFEQLLPLLRRTFSTFTDPERRQLGRMIAGRTTTQADEQQVDPNRAELILPTFAELIGFTPPTTDEKSHDE